jgi:glycosyltransferase involved in cell wall biosynthesis
MDLSVIVVTKNEAANIGRCIESILADTKGLKTEIVVVDSRSDDGTVEAARTYPVTVAQLQANALITSHAGRYVGTLLSTGKYLCYLDGDMVVIPGWMPKAIEILKKGEVQAVGGRLFRVFPGEDLSMNHPDNYVMGPVHGFGGAGVYVGDLIRSVGPFNPFMRGEGERELGFRLRRAGAKILRVDVPMVYHMDKPRTVGEIDEKAGMFAGIGQAFRRYPTEEITRSLLKAHRIILLEIAFVWALILVPVILLVLGHAAAAGIAAVLSLLIFGGLTIWKGVAKTALYVRSRVMNSVHVVRGLFLGLKDSREYFALYDVIRRAS